MNKFYITTPLYYVNAKPHLGTLYSTLLADVTARFQQLHGKEVFLLTGTDEHGQKIAEAAAAAGTSPKEFVDSIVPAYKEVWARYGIEYNKFIRTTDAEHEAAVVTWIEKLKEQGDIYKSTYTGLYCTPCETFVTGDETSCPTCGRGLKEISEENYFFRLSAYQDKLLKFYEEHSAFIMPKERLNEVISFVKGGLQDLSLSRTGVKWGIPFPGDPAHTVYVWGDALLNYISAVGYGYDEQLLQKWWPADLQVMAKDIVRFHAVYWPAFLMAAGIEPPKKLLVHGYILVDKTKMSKSLGNVVDPLYLADTYGHEPVRYYLLRQMSTAQDGNFAIDDLENRITADLANSLGNLLNRVLTLGIRGGLETVPAPATSLEPRSVALHMQCIEAVRDYWDEMTRGQFHLALAHLWQFIAHVNAYVNDTEPWKLQKQNPELFAEVISCICHSLHTVGILLWPIMPRKMTELLGAIGIQLTLGTNYEPLLRENTWNHTYKLLQTDGPLFIKPPERIQEKTVPEETTKTSHIDINDFAKIELHVGEITACEPVEGSDKLLKLQVDLGPLGKRQILSGVQKNFTLEELVGTQGVFVTNLPPRKMAGQLSEGMMLFAKDDEGRMASATVGKAVANGTRLS